jgi:hypothetical protein
MNDIRNDQSHEGKGIGTNLVTVGDTEAEGGYARTAESNAEKADELLSDDVGPGRENLL